MGTDRRRSQPASEDSEDADTSSRDAEAWHDARVRGGVIRQSLPNALQHQVEASQLAANKRQAEVADPAEQRAKRAAAEQVRLENSPCCSQIWQDALFSWLRSGFAFSNFQNVLSLPPIHPSTGTKISHIHR